VAIARVMECDEDFCELIELAAPMHDVGKIGIDDAILKKPGKLTHEEFAMMKTHTSIGGRILEGDESLIQAARQIALSHHEKWDGSGYPLGLQGDDIPLSGRICSVADIFDALTMERPYKEAWPFEKAVALIEEWRGNALDPRVVDAFLQILPEIREIKARYQEGTINPKEVLVTSSMGDDDVWMPWKKEYSVGIHIIDAHHRYLLHWTNRVYGAVRDHAGADQVAKALSALDQYTRIHFAAEEDMMIAYGYTDIDEHKKLHRSFESYLATLRAEMYHNPLILGMEITEYLRHWWINHIVKVDTEIMAKSVHLLGS
jgi:hemerythrin-like metal-binding protein